MSTKADNIEINVADGIRELVVRQGEAAKVHEPVAVTYKAQINAVREFISKRNPDPARAVITINQIAGEIRLDVDPGNPVGTTIIGGLAVSKDILEFKINGDKAMGLREFREFLRPRRMFFVDREHYAVIMATLDNWASSTTISVQDANNRKGSSAMATQKDSKMPNNAKGFSLSMPVFVGHVKTTFYVEICMEMVDGQPNFWLESLDLLEIIRTTKEMAIEGEAKVFGDLPYVVFHV